MHTPKELCQLPNPNAIMNYQQAFKKKDKNKNSLMERK